MWAKVNNELYHYGTPRHSGRYPWGSGERPYQSLRDKIKSVYPDYPDNDANTQQTRNGLLKKGTEVKRIASASEKTGDPNKRKYVSLTQYDNQTYADMWEYFTVDDPEQHVYELTTDVKIAEGKEVLQDLISRYGDMPMKEYLDLNLTVSEQGRADDMGSAYRYRLPSKEKKNNPYYSESYSKSQYEYYKQKGFTDDELRAAYELRTQKARIVDLVRKLLYKDKQLSEEVFADYRKRGYDAMVDVEDWFTEYAEYPVILLNPAETAKLKRVNRYLEEGFEYY